MFERVVLEISVWTDRQTDMHITMLIPAPLLRIYGDKLPTDSDAANQSDAAILLLSYSRIRGYSIYESVFEYIVGMRLSCNFVNVYTIAYRVHIYTRASLMHSRNPNPYSSNRISP